jgi:hypothetical protein
LTRWPQGRSCRGYTHDELKTMDLSNRSPGVNLTAPVTPEEATTCTHIVAYVEPEGWYYFVVKKEHTLTDGGNIFVAVDDNGNLRSPRPGSKELRRFQRQVGRTPAVTAPRAPGRIAGLVRRALSIRQPWVELILRGIKRAPLPFSPHRDP